MMYDKIYLNLLAQAQKLYRHCRQCSYKTRDRYEKAFNRFLMFLAIVYMLQKITNISGKHLSSYVEYMQYKNNSAAYIKTELSAIRFWHDQIPKAKHSLPPNDALDLERRKFRGNDRTWTNEEFAYMVAEAAKNDRDEYVAAMYLARYMGLRIHEAYRIDTAIARAALKDGYLTIKGKGGKVREVPNYRSVEIILENLLKVTPTGQKLLLPAKQKTHNAIKELQQFVADTRVPRHEGQSKTSITFHGLRHNCAADWYMTLISKGYTEKEARRQVSKWLGHERDDINRRVSCLAGVGDEPCAEQTIQPEYPGLSRSYTWNRESQNGQHSACHHRNTQIHFPG